jgi:hypothetical protein
VKRLRSRNVRQTCVIACIVDALMGFALGVTGTRMSVLANRPRKLRGFRALLLSSFHAVDCEFKISSDVLFLLLDGQRWVLGI